MPRINPGVAAVLATLTLLPASPAAADPAGSSSTRPSAALSGAALSGPAQAGWAPSRPVRSGGAVSGVARPADHRRPVALWAAAQVPAPAAGGAFVYDDQLVPAGARITVLTVSKRRTESWLAVNRLLPNRVYGAHLHVNPCAALPTAAGPHYQRVADPVQPSTDPAYANPRNEVWLDLRTNSRGNGFASSVNRWSYRTPPASLVLHAMGTATHPGHAGTAGARIACLTLTAAR